jgi:hypothetical protein
LPQRTMCPAVLQHSPLARKRAFAVPRIAPRWDSLRPGRDETRGSRGGRSRRRRSRRVWMQSLVSVSRGVRALIWWVGGVAGEAGAESDEGVRQGLRRSAIAGSSAAG